jgi:hypothetical protein
MPEAYAVWVHNFYNEESDSAYIANQIQLQQQFWALVFSEQITTSMSDQEIRALREGNSQ